MLDQKVFGEKLRNHRKNECEYGNLQSLCIPRFLYINGALNFNALFTTLFKLYEFRINDSEVLIIDDPLTSYDMINQYKTLFEITNSVSENKKIIVFKMKAKKNYRKKQGHRQAYTKVTIKEIIA